MYALCSGELFNIFKTCFGLGKGSIKKEKKSDIYHLGGEVRGPLSLSIFLFFFVPNVLNIISSIQL